MPESALRQAVWSRSASITGRAPNRIGCTLHRVGARDGDAMRHGALTVVKPRKGDTMSIFGTIMDKIFHHGAAAASSTIEASRDDAAAGSTQPAARSGATSAAAAPGEAVDVEAVLN